MPNIALNRKFKSKLLLWSIGDLLFDYLAATTDAAKTAALNTLAPSLKPVQTKDLDISMEGETVEREHDGLSWGNNAKQYTTDVVKITGKIELAGSGTAGEPPAYRELFLLSGHAEVIDTDNVKYIPITKDFDMGTVAFVLDGQFHIGHKAQLELKNTANAGEVGYWEFELTMVGGTVPVETPANINQSIVGYIPPKAINFSNTPRFTLGAKSFAMSAFAHTTGNEVTALDIVNHQSANIGDRKPMVNITVGAPALSEVNLYQKAWDSETMLLGIQHGTQPGQRVGMHYPAVTLGMPKAADISGALGYDIECAAQNHDDGVYQIIFS